MASRDWLLWLTPEATVSGRHRGEDRETGQEREQGGREEGFCPPNSQISTFQCLFYPFLILGFPHVSQPSAGRSSKLCGHLAVGKEGGAAKWVVASCTAAKDRLFMETYSHHRKHTRKGVLRGPYQRPGSSDILLLSSQIYKEGCRAWESGQPSPGRGTALESPMTCVHICERVCMPWHLCAAGPHVPVCRGYGTIQPCVCMSTSPSVPTAMCVLPALVCILCRVFCVLMRKACHKPQYVYTAV